MSCPQTLLSAPGEVLNSAQNSNQSNIHCRAEFDSVDQTSALDETRRAMELKSSYPEFDTLLLRFLVKLQAVPILSTRDSFAIQPGRYATCLESLQQDDEDVWSYVIDKLRFDLISDTILTVKMQTVFHEFLLGKVRQSINSQLEHSLPMSADDSTKKLLCGINSYGTADVQVANGFQCPDESYTVTPFDLSGIVLEISFSQALESLSSKAKRYLLESEGGGVQVVVGIKSTYPEADDLSIHVWRLCGKSNGDETGRKVWKEVEDQIIDEESASPRRYTLKLEDFAPAEALASVYPGADLEKEVVLKYKDLLMYYQRAKEHHQQRLRAKHQDAR